MENQMKRLGDAELDIMLAVWDAKNPVTSGYVLKHLQARRNWALSTLMTTMARLEDKGFIICDRNTRTNYYSPLISMKDYKARESRSFLERMYGNSLQNLVTSLYDSDAINETDILELRKLLDRIEEGKENDA